MPNHSPSTSSGAIAPPWRTAVMLQTALPRAQLKAMPLELIANRVTQNTPIEAARGVTAATTDPSQANANDDPISDSESWDWGSDFEADASAAESDDTFELHTCQIFRSQAAWTDFSALSMTGAQARLLPDGDQGTAVSASSDPPPPPPPRRPTSQLPPILVPTVLTQLHSPFNTRKES